MTMTQKDNYLQEIIRLQLRKPKNWNWELSTSKSSPQIALPIIQLYDAKGNLLIQTKDCGGTQRQSWHSSDVNGKRELNRRLQRCRSDTADHNSGGFYAKESIPMRRDKIESNAKLIRSLKTALDNARNRKLADGADKTKGQYADENGVCGSGINRQRTLKIRKSRSDVIEFKDNTSSSSSENLKRADVGYPIQKNRSASDVIRARAELRRHKRSRSDDLFRRKLKYNEESMKRAESDGYKNFITANIKENDADKSTNSAGKPQRNKMNMAVAENVLLGNNGGKIEVKHLKHNRYTTRTSNAGTLIIREPSFNPQKRRRSKPDEAPMEKFAESNVRQGSDPTGGGGGGRGMFQPRYFTGMGHGQGQNQYEERRSYEMDRLGSIRSKSAEKYNAHPKTNLCNSRSALFLFRELSNEQDDDQCVNNSDYIVHEPITPDSRKSSIPATPNELTSIYEKFEEESTKGHIVKEHNKLHRNKQDTGIGNGNGDTDLLQLVRRISCNDHVNMGANVSRHSAKGLSGRRSQSSGSICNGKGRHPDGKICSSLPSYLDEKDGSGCNNNHHDCEKPPIDEVDRIPPLGDGAPLHWKFSDNQTVLCDQGYGSERSPEEEYPPPLPDHENQCHHHLEPHACYPFITPESTFLVKLLKGSRGLGLSVTGGIDSTGAWPGLIRIKRLFPHQPASTCGLLNVGDLLIEANGITLTGLTNYEALEVLRTAPNQVELKVCRPPPDVLNCVSPISEVPPPPPRREPPTTLHLPSSTAYSSPDEDYYHGEFEVTLTKIQGSLGFTLRKEDDSALGHYVRALVREPALTDGRIRAGDKIIAVNDVEISPMSHEQAVQYLRQCSEVVKLRLYRDLAQTPVALLSPTETTPRTSFSRKAHLRQEAVDMLNDIAVRKLTSGNQQQQDTYRRSLSPNASPRRLRRHPCPSDASHITDSSTYVHQLQNDEQFHEGLLQKCSHPFDDDAFNSLFSIESDDGDRPSRPSSLDLYNPNQTPVAARKPRFNFSLAHNQYELNNLDPEVLDAPNLTYNLGNDDVTSKDVECGDSFPQEPASMPHIPLDTPATFSHKNPAYQSAHPPCGPDDDRSSTSSRPSTASKTKNIGTDDGNMRKWKGITLEKEAPRTETRRMKMPEEYEVLAIELNRGWNSRLGFSLQGAAGVTYVSAVHADSVAAKDGRLKPGDRVIKVNDESVENMTTNEIIDLLRIVRGPVCIVISRVKSNEDCPKSNAEN